jgi:phosphate:Na+ symporter
MGIAIGAAVPVLLSALGANVNGRRTAFVYLIVEVLGVVIWATIFYLANAIFRFSFTDRTMNPVSIAFVNTLFRFAKVVVLLPFTKGIERIVTLLIKDKQATAAHTDDMMRLEERFLQYPALAIEQSRITINAMAKEARDNLTAAFALLTSYSDKGFETVREMEGTVDRYEDALGTYLVKITGQDLSAKQNEDVSKYLHTLSDFERISDHALNIGEAAQEIHQKKMKFSDSAARELNVIRTAINDIVALSVDAFVDNDLQMASRVEPLEELIDNLCDELKLHHIDRLQKGSCTLTQGFVFNDLLTNFERIADHCSNIAVAMIELQSDSFDTHEYISSLKEMKNESFARYYEEYSQKYVI